VNPPIGVKDLKNPYMDEIYEMLTYFRYALQRGNQMDELDFYDRVTPDTPPVLLLHGFLGTRGAMFPLEYRLKRDGFVVFSIDLGVLNIGDIRKSALSIHQKIQKILREVDLNKIDIVGHSMGGLIGLYYIKKLSGHQFVRKMITLGTPHDGTWISLLGVATLGLISPSIWQLIPDSFFLRELKADPLPPEVEYHSIAGSHDFVSPATRSRLQGSIHTEIPCGHAGLANSSRVYRVLKNILLDNPR